jgi:hypothetical protein
MVRGPRRWLRKQQRPINRGKVFSVLFVLIYYKQDYLLERVSVSGVESTVMGQSPAGQNVSSEAKDIVGSRYQKTGEHIRLRRLKCVL